MEKVSIIIPAYNAEKTLERCIESVINQSYKNIEIIVINDGSVDNTLAIIEKYAVEEARIIVVNQDNKGVSYSRNYGVKICSGDYISFIDADDWLEEFFIEKMLRTIKEKNVDFVRCNYYIENMDSTIEANLYDLKNALVYKEDISKNTIYSHFLYNIQPINNYVMLLLIKAELIKDKILFDEDLYMMEDVLFYTKLFLNSNSFYFLNEYLYHYNNISVSSTRSIGRVEKNVFGILNSVTKINKYLEETKSIYNEALLNYNCMNLIINYLEKIPLNDINTKLSAILKKLFKEEKFRCIIKHCNLSYFNIYRKFILYTFKMGKISIVVCLFRIRKLRSKE